jgi:hypothetical protein
MSNLPSIKNDHETKDMSQLRPFEFLQLPGEIRNRIYDIMMKDSNGESHLQDPARIAAQAQTTKQASSPTPITSDTTPNEAQDFPLPDHVHYHSFKQTCHQLHAKFGPLINQKQPIKLSIQELYAYISQTSLSAPVHTLHVNPSLPCDVSVDIFRLVRLMHKKPHLDMQIIDDDGQQKDFYKLFHALLSTYNDWKDVVALAELRVCLENETWKDYHGVEKSKQVFVLRLIVAPVTSTTLVKENGGNGKHAKLKVELAPSVEHVTEFIIRARLVGLLSPLHFKVVCDFGVGSAMWAFVEGPRGPFSSK